MAVEAPPAKERARQRRTGVPGREPGSPSTLPGRARAGAAGRPVARRAARAGARGTGAPASRRLAARMAQGGAAHRPGQEVRPDGGALAGDPGHGRDGRPDRLVPPRAPGRDPRRWPATRAIGRPARSPRIAPGAGAGPGAAAAARGAGLRARRAARSHASAHRDRPRLRGLAGGGRAGAGGRGPRPGRGRGGPAARRRPPCPSAGTAGDITVSYDAIGEGAAGAGDAGHDRRGEARRGGHGRAAASGRRRAPSAGAAGRAGLADAGRGYQGSRAPTKE